MGKQKEVGSSIFFLILVYSQHYLLDFPHKNQIKQQKTNTF